MASGSLLVTGLLAACSSSSSEPTGGAADAGASETGPADAMTDASDADAAVCALPGVFGNDACHQCMSRRCCTSLDACEAHSTCKPLLACILPCLPKPDAGGCRSACVAQHPGGEALIDSIALCMGRSGDAGCGDVCTAP